MNDKQRNVQAYWCMKNLSEPMVADIKKKGNKQVSTEMLDMQLGDTQDNTFNSHKIVCGN